jgi:hypothetical protein
MAYSTTVNNQLSSSYLFTLEVSINRWYHTSMNTTRVNPPEVERSVELDTFAQVILYRTHERLSMAYSIPDPPSRRHLPFDRLMALSKSKGFVALDRFSRSTGSRS